MIRFDKQSEIDELRAMLPEKMTAQEMWTLVKFLKHVRGRCRNNSAFNNYMRRVFGNEFEFSEVEKTGFRGSYKGLRITRRDTGEATDGGDSD